MDELDDPFAPTEMDPQGVMSTEYMERLLLAYQQGVFFWNDDLTTLLYRDPQSRKAAPIAESIIEQAKEEAFLAWGL